MTSLRRFVTLFESLPPTPCVEPEPLDAAQAEVPELEEIPPPQPSPIPLD